MTGEVNGFEQLMNKYSDYGKEDEEKKTSTKKRLKPFLMIGPKKIGCWR